MLTRGEFLEKISMMIACKEITFYTDWKDAVETVKDNDAEQRAKIEAKDAEIARLNHELNATIKAKQENDERFMTERDAARIENARLRKIKAAARKYVSAPEKCEICFEDMCDSRDCDCGCHVEIENEKNELKRALEAHDDERGTCQDA